MIHVPLACNFDEIACRSRLSRISPVQLNRPMDAWKMLSYGHGASPKVRSAQTRTEIYECRHEILPGTFHMRSRD